MQRQRHREGGHAAGALGLDAAPVGLGDALGDGKPQTMASRGPGRVRPVKPLKQMAQPLRRLLASPFGDGDARERELKITVPETLKYEDAFDDLFERYTDKLELESVKTSGMGSVFELKYRVRMRRDVSHKAFLDALRCRNGNLPIQLCHTDTQEGIL